jgi:protein-S-isoprenylcysteine O-methyltransferase Ste14
MSSSLVTLLAVAGYGALHSLLATVWVKRRAATALGSSGRRLYRVSYNLVALLTLLPVLAVPALQPGLIVYRLSWPWAALALVGQGLALFFLVLGLLQTDPWHFLGIRQLLLEADRETPRLVVTGLYRWVRHPLYVAGLAFVWLTPILTVNLLLLNLGLTLYVLIGSRFEEQRLLAEFGPAYASYQVRVPRLIPRPWRHLPPN